MFSHQDTAPSHGEVALSCTGRRFPSPEHGRLHLEVSWRQATCDVAKASDDDCSGFALRFPRICVQRCRLLRACERALGNPKVKGTSQVDPASHMRFSQDAELPQGEKVGFRPRPALSLSPSIRWPLNRETQSRTIRRPIPTIRPTSERLLPSETSKTALALRTKPDRMVGERIQRLSSLRSSSVRSTTLGDFRPRMSTSSRQLVPAWITTNAWTCPVLSTARIRTPYSVDLY